MSLHDITDEVGSLDPDQPRAIEVAGRIVALVRTEAGVFAVDNTCTHAEASLADGYVMDGWIECPLHQARYDLASGALLDGPDCPGLGTYEVTESDGRYWLTLG